MSKSPSLPSHRVYAVTKDGKQKFWRAIGAAWPHSDGEGFLLKLDYRPQLRKPIAKMIRCNGRWKPTSK